MHHLPDMGSAPADRGRIFSAFCRRRVGSGQSGEAATAAAHQSGQQGSAAAGRLAIGPALHMGVLRDGLILTVRDAIPKAHALATAEFATLRLRLLKLGTRFIETASRVWLAFAAACPEARLMRHIAGAINGASTRIDRSTRWGFRSASTGNARARSAAAPTDDKRRRGGYSSHSSG